MLQYLVEVENQGGRVVSISFVRFGGEKKQFFINLLSKIMRLKCKKANAKNIARESCRLAVTRLAVSDPLQRQTNPHSTDIMITDYISFHRSSTAYQTRLPSLIIYMFLKLSSYLQKILKNVNSHSQKYYITMSIERRICIHV